MESNFARSFSTAVAVVVALSWRRQAHQAAAAPSPAALASAVPSDRGSARRQRRGAVGVSWAWSSLAYPLSHTAEFSRKVNPCEATGRLPWCQLHSQACEGRCSGSAEVRDKGSRPRPDREKLQADFRDVRRFERPSIQRMTDAGGEPPWPAVTGEDWLLIPYIRTKTTTTNMTLRAATVTPKPHPCGLP